MSFNFGGSDKQTQTQQNQVSNPWQPTQPALQNLLGKLGMMPTSVTPAQTQAFSQLEQNASAGNPWAPQIGAAATSQLGAPSYNATVNNAYGALQGQLSGIASPTSLDPMSNPYTKGALSTLNSDITNQINQEFAAAGRDGSGANAQALARGLAQGEGGLLMGQYNTNVGNQANAANSLENAGINTASANQSLDAARAAIQNQGANTADAALAAQNYAPSQTLNLEQQKTQLPFTNLGLLASILYPMAGLGGQVSGTSTSNTTGTNYGYGLSINQLSDERAKTDKERVGKMDDGTPIYRYRYKGDPVTRVGPMAQDVEKRTPEAVSDDGPGGLKTVDMDLATRKAAKIARGRLAARKSGRAA